MMKNKILVICTLVHLLLLKYKDDIEYLPLSNEATDASWEKLLLKYQPTAIVFGLQAIDENKLSLWRKLKPDDDLKFVRKGTSMHRVDFAAAKKYNINVLNIPGVNAPFVARFISDILLTDNNQNTTIAILGVGEIGRLVTRKVITARQHVLLYSRTHYSFDGNHYSYSNDLLNIFTCAEQVAICLPLNDATKGIIAAEHIHALPKNTEIVCVSPPRVMSASAIVALDHRDDITVVFDHVASGMQFIEESLSRNQLRPGFTFAERAASSDECQGAMGEAAIVSAMS